MRSRRLSLLGLVVVVVASCGGGTPQPRHAALSSRWAAPEILSHIPADTPYMFALLEPISDVLRRTMMQNLGARLAPVLQAVDKLRGTDRARREPWIRAVIALADALAGKDPASWGDALGIDPRGHFALYGLSVWPVLRVELTSPAKLRSVLERMLSAAGASLEQHTFGGHAYWLAADADMAVVAAVLDREAVMALVPARSLAVALPLVLGTQAPEPSLARTTTVPDLLARHRFLGIFLAYLDAHRLVDVVAGASASPLGAPIRALTGPVSPVCRADLDRLAAIVPRLVLGYRRFDASGFEGSAVFELTASAVSALGKLHTAVPEVTAPATGHPLLALGAAADPAELVAWLRGVTRQLHDHPFACPWLAGINQAGSELGKKLAAPLPPIWRGLQGGSLVIDDASILPPSVTGHLLVVGDRVADLVTSFAGAIPAIAGIPLARDGRPIALPIQQLRLPVGSAHAALTTDRLVIAAGQDSARRATDYLAVPAPKRSPLLTIAVNVPRLQQLQAALGQAPVGSFASIDDAGMRVDVLDDGLHLDIWGTHTAPPTAHP